MQEIAVGCECGTMRGVADVGPSRGSRVICYCDDCQVYARYLGKSHVLDAHGGTDIFQMTPAQLRITHGLGQLRCTRLSPKGLMRWSAGCCNSPIGNTLAAPGFPFVGMVHTFFQPGTRSLDDFLGPPVARIQARFAWGTPPAGSHPKAPLGFILRILKQLAGARLAGRQKPSPFFDAQTGRPVVEPVVLPLEQRQSLAAKLGATA